MILAHPVHRLLRPLALVLAHLVVAAIASAASQPTPGLRLYVDPDGLDSWTGTQSRADPSRHRGPYATIEAAIARAREFHATNPTALVSIQLSAGRHEIHRPIILGEGDNHLLIAGNRLGRASVISGGTRLTRWQPVPGKKGQWQTSLPSVAGGFWYFNQLFLDGVRLQRARTPNSGFLQAAGPLSTGSPIALPFKPGDIRPDWASDPDTRVIILMKWTDLHLPIRAVDTANSVATLAGGPRSAWMDEPDARYWIEDTAEALDIPGEWHLDRPTGTLVVHTPNGASPAKSELVAPRINTLLHMQGTPAKPIRDIVLKDITFTDADYAMPTNGLISPQAAVLIPGTITARHAVSCRIERCRFTGLGGYGIELGRGCQHWLISANRFEQLGAGGIRLGETGDRNPSPVDANHSHEVSDNELVGLGRIFAPAVGILVAQSGTNRIIHNRISDLYYTAISVGWNWSYESSPCRGHEIAWNLVERIGQGRLSDMGGIYTLGPQPGTRIHHNLFRDIESYRYGGWGLYTDEGSSGIVLENNVVYRCTDAGFHQHYGRDNVVRNNLLAFNRNHQVMRTRNEAHRSFSFTRNVVIHDQGTLLGSNWDGDTNRFVMERNLYWDTRLRGDQARYRLGKLPWDAWRASGQDAGSVIADPLLKDPLRPELGFRNGSPAAAIGFEPIDLGKIGPRK